MPVWHVSIARLNKRGDQLLKVQEWPNNVRNQASELANRVLSGVGGLWQQDEIGDCAIHRRRRLSADEMRLLHKINASCPVFTYGQALKAVLPAGATA